MDTVQRILQHNKQKGEQQYSKTIAMAKDDKQEKSMVKQNDDML